MQYWGTEIPQINLLYKFRVINLNSTSLHHQLSHFALIHKSVGVEEKLIIT